MARPSFCPSADAAAVSPTPIVEVGKAKQDPGYSPVQMSQGSAPVPVRTAKSTPGADVAGASPSDVARMSHNPSADAASASLSCGADVAGKPSPGKDVAGVNPVNHGRGR